jgi:hypothetical protein
MTTFKGNNKDAMVEHIITCDECKELVKEELKLGVIRETIREDMRTIIREELAIYLDHEERISDLEFWNGEFKIGKKRFYILPIAVIGGFLYWLYTKIRGY